MTCLLTIRPGGRTIQVGEGQTLLEAILEQGDDFPFGCTAGVCSACKCRLVSGEVSSSDMARFTLMEAELAEGAILACQTIPLTDCVIERQLPYGEPVQEWQGVVHEVEFLASDTARVLVAPQGNGRCFRFRPGQYAFVSFPGYPARALSMANSPDEKILEFLARRVPGGRVTGFIFEALAPGTAVLIQGPFGNSYLREEYTGPILAVAGGTGFAPIKSIVSTALAQGMANQIKVYFGVPTRKQLFYERLLNCWSRSHPNVKVKVALSHEVQTYPNFARGFIHEVLKEDLHARDLSEFVAYMAGPPKMVESVIRVVLEHGLREDRCFSDPFEFQSGGAG